MGRRSLASVLGLALVVASLSLDTGSAIASPGTPVFINEFHYDNTGTDAGEFVEIAGPAGTVLTGWSVVLYNGANGLKYDTDALAGSIPDQQNGFGTVSLSYPVNGIQNGAPDGIALVNGTTVVQFLSYEGAFTALDGLCLTLLPEQLNGGCNVASRFFKSFFTGLHRNARFLAQFFDIFCRNSHAGTR